MREKPLRWSLTESSIPVFSRSLIFFSTVSTTSYVDVSMKVFTVLESWSYKLACKSYFFCSNSSSISGEAFISDNAVKQEIQERLHPMAVDMESAAVGHCCYLNEMPFVSIRCISDNADDEGAMSFDQFEKIAAKRVADLVLAIAAVL